MQMKYWRHYPKFLQIILLLLMLVTMAFFGIAVGGFLVKILFGVDATVVATLNAKSTPTVVHAAQLLQGSISLFAFLVTALVFAYLTHPSPMAYLGLRKPTIKIQWLIVLALAIAFVPLISQVGEWLQHLDLGSKAKLNYEENDNMLRGLMNGTKITDLLLYLLLFAALPAFGEELLFRGVLLRFAYFSSRNIHLAIFIVAALFAMAHGTIYNFVPIMLAGVLLGYIYYYSGSIWLSILAHFINNAIMVFAVYLGNTHYISEEASKADSFPWYIIGLSVALFALIFSLLRKKATPLPPDWTDDFKGEAQTID